MSRLLPVILAGLVLAGGGCKSKKEHCDRLVQLACDHLEGKKGGEERCAELRLPAEHVDDDKCRESLRLIQEAGNAQSTGAE